MASAVGAFTAFQAQAATYYVSSSGGSDSNAGTSTAAPWQTLQKLSATTFSPGDTIKFKAGDTFTGHAWQISSSGSDSTTGLITVTSYGSGSKPILDGTGMPTGEYSLSGSESVACLVNLAANVNYWKFHNLSFRATEIGIHCYHPSEVTAAQNYIEIFACNFSYCSNACIRLQAMSGRRINGVRISHCNLAHSQSGIKLTRCYDTVLTLSNISEMEWGAIGMTDTTSGGEITDCDIWRTGKAYKSSGQTAVYLGNVRDLLIDNCSIAYTYRAVNPSDPTQFSPDGVAIDFESANMDVTVSNCTLHSNDGAAVLIYRNPTWGFENRPLYFLNNTIYNNGLKGSSGGAPGGAQFIRHLQAKVSSPGDFAQIEAGYGGIISGNNVTLSNGTTTYQVLTQSSILTNTAPSWYSLETP
jgi:hypothetical protein